MQCTGESSIILDKPCVGGACASTSEFLDSEMEEPVSSTKSNKRANTSSGTLGNGDGVDFDSKTNEPAKKKMRNESCESEDLVVGEMEPDFISSTIVSSDKSLLNPSSSNMDTQKQLPNIMNNCDKVATMSNVNLGNSTDVDFNNNTEEQGGSQVSLGNTGSSDFASMDTDDDPIALFHAHNRAPTRASFAAQPSLAEQLTNITAQIAKLEEDLPGIDAFIDEMCYVDSSWKP